MVQRRRRRLGLPGLITLYNDDRACFDIGDTLSLDSGTRPWNRARRGNATTRRDAGAAGMSLKALSIPAHYASQGSVIVQVSHVTQVATE